MHRKFAFSVLQMIPHHLLSFLGEVGSIIGPPSVQTHLPPHTYLLSATSEAGAVAEYRERQVRLPSSNLLFQPSRNWLFGSLRSWPLLLELLYYNRTQKLPQTAYQRGKLICARPPETVVVQWCDMHGIRLGKQCPLLSHRLPLTHNCLHLSTRMCALQYM